MTAATVAAERLVNAKYALDTERRRDGKHPVLPMAFVEFALPFASGGGGTSTDRVEAVPSGCVVGATWNAAWSSAPDEADAHALADRLDRLALDRSEPNWAIVVQVGALPLWYAVEGKNRVEMYRRIGRPLLAELRASHHPDPRELVVRRGDGIDGVSRIQTPQVVSPLPIGAAADLLLAQGAEAGPPLTADTLERVAAAAQRRSAFLDTRW